MSDTEDLSRFCGLNTKCHRHGQRNVGNLLVVDRYSKARHRPPFCRDCKARFSDFPSTPFFNSHLPHDTDDENNIRDRKYQIADRKVIL